MPLDYKKVIMLLDYVYYAIRLQKGYYAIRLQKGYYARLQKGYYAIRLQKVYYAIRLQKGYYAIRLQKVYYAIRFYNAITLWIFFLKYAAFFGDVFLDSWIYLDFIFNFSLPSLSLSISSNRKLTKSIRQDDE